MKLKYIFIITLIPLFFECKQEQRSVKIEKTKDLVFYVNPFIGTSGHGHTYPGASLPFGMMQLSPDTRLDGWDGCSGYHYSDSEIYGFSHTHLSGTGVSDYGDILLMPTDKVVFNNGADGEEGYKSRFSHQDEKAQPGYYKVHLSDTGIDVQLTVSERSGVHKYSFPKNQKQLLIMDLEHRDEVLASKLNLVSEKEISGYRHSKAWATRQNLFFNIQFSKPYTKVTLLGGKKEGKRVKAAFEFDSTAGQILEIKVGISAVDEKGAKKNLEHEVGTKSFEQVREQARQVWEAQLEKIIVESLSEDDKITFYTSLYHTMIAPNLYQDIDGRYRGMDLKIHQTKKFNYYTVFSLWDTYRAAHPLYTIIEQERTNHFINTFLAKYDEGGIMPIWDLSGCYTGCMIGYHAVPVIADAFLKGIKNYNVEKAFKAMKHSAMQDKLGLSSYKKIGFIPVEKESESVSKTLEYAYDDWTIAQMAKALGKGQDYKYFTERAQYYKNIFDPQSQFMRGRFRNTWFSPFDPYEVNFNYTEANSWQYSFYAPQDVSGLIKLFGGKEKLETSLDKLFNAQSGTTGRKQADITGMIGQYAHGNEPSHHIAYLYNFVNKPHKTQERVRQILTEQYKNAPDGISGNEDCGQMSAWYIFSSLGFYPVTPASNQYIIGTPLVKGASLNLETGKVFTVLSHNLSTSNKYIEKVKLNGKALRRSYIYHKEIVNGGLLEFYMTNNPSQWGTLEGWEPKTEIKQHSIVPAPYIANGQIAFENKTALTLKSVDKESIIFYSLNNTEFTKYTEPIEVTEKGVLQVYAEKDGKKSAVITSKLNKINPNISIKLHTAYANQYSAGGQNALIDGVLGTKDFKTGTWQGYFNTDLIAVVDLGKQRKISTVQINFLENQDSWIFLPTSVECLLSTDGKKFVSLHKNKKIEASKPTDEVYIKNVVFKQFDKKYRYVKIKAIKLASLPQWHLGYKHKGKPWLFADEIQIK
ncbi:MAG: GH92 family glycosyl hydrolase [Tenacibaculum sp.]